MNIQEKFKNIVGQSESETLIYKTVLPPSKSIARMVAALSNKNGGYIILGIKVLNNNIEVKGLNEDFKAKSITFKASRLLTPNVNVQAEYFHKNGKKLFGIKVDKSVSTIQFENKEYVIDNGIIKSKTPLNNTVSTTAPSVINALKEKLQVFLNNSTEAKRKVINHYLDGFEIIVDSQRILFPLNTATVTDSLKGKLLQRILFASFADNFETYLSDLLHEIYLANPNTLRSSTKTVVINDVLDCSDIQEFIELLAKKKISSLQKGSVKGFIKDNKQIRDLKIIDKMMENEIEKILQIRHLYTHRNGIVDEKFCKYFNSAILNSEHIMSIDEMCSNVEYLAEVFHKIDAAATAKYNLSVITAI